MGWRWRREEESNDFGSLEALLCYVVAADDASAARWLNHDEICFYINNIYEI
jgi:hypothetical protein